MRVTRILSMLVAALWAAGCTMIPQYERPEAPIAAAFPDSTGTSEAAAADIAWADVFSDDRLKTLIGLALANNLDLRVAALNVEQSAARHRIQRSELIPGVSGTLRYTHTESDDQNRSEWNSTVGISAYELDFFGRLRSLNRQALETFLQTTEARRSVHISLVSEVAIQYFTLRQAEAQLDLALRTRQAVEEYFALIKATFDAGESNELDLSTSDAQVQTATINILTSERLIAQARNNLTLLVGQPLPANLPPPRQFDDSNLVVEVPTGLPSSLLQRRPDILAAEHGLKSANASIGAARAAFFPSISLTASYGETSAEFDTVIGADGAWAFSPQLSLPIFTGGRNRANLDVARIGTRIEVANYQRSIQSAFREVADALAGARTYGEQLKAQSTLINAQRKRYELASARYRAGEAGYLDVLTAQQDLYGAEQGLLQTRLDQLTSRISLYRSLGGGWK